MARRAFRRSPESVWTARHFVADELSSAPGEVIERANLMVSELATNAIRHAGTDFVVRVEQHDTNILIEITDSGVGMPTMRIGQPRDSSGRGLRIVEALSDSWGVRPDPGGKGKSVWFTLSL